MELEMIVLPDVVISAGPNRHDADSLNRVVKMAIDTGEVETVAAGYELFHSYRVAVLFGPEGAASPAHQAALLTIVNTARRALLGGVVVVGRCDVPLITPRPHFATLAEAVEKLGGQLAHTLPPTIPVLILGQDTPEVFDHCPLALRVTFEDWRGGVIPASDGRRLSETNAIVPAAVLAAAFGVSEVFQFLRGNVMAGSRSVGISLWSPQSLDWEHAPAGPVDIVLPSRLWVIGLGHLGQAYLWVLGLLPYRSPEDVELVFQDFDLLTLANDSTSLLTNPKLVGQRKTRAMATWAESRGFRTRLVERIFPGGMKIADDEPRLALGGVDNPQARAAYEDAGFDGVIEAGLGAGPTEYLAMRIHAFPASVRARKKWGGPGHDGEIQPPHTNAYAGLAAEGMDACGLVRLATRTVGAPFVGAAAAALVIAEVLRVLNGGPRFEVIDLTLRDPASRDVVELMEYRKDWNPGFTK
jgi:hypothetical protein